MRDSKGKFNHDPRPEKIKGWYKKCDWKDCNNQIWTVPFRAKRNQDKYCGRKCRGLAERGIVWNLNTTFKKGHKTWNKGKFGTQSHVWKKGDNLDYVTLHKHIKFYLPKPNNCQSCNKKTTRLDLSNKSYKYLNDISDWEWLCRSCHNKKDWRNGNPQAKIFDKNGKRITI